MRIILGFVALLSAATPTFAQSFSCGFGKEPACLDYGDKVCSTFGKCVKDDAVCFDSYQCNYEGFTCKSNVTNCVEKNEELIDDYNNLLNEYDELLGKAKDVATSYDDLKSCLLSASDMRDVERCSLYY